MKVLKILLSNCTFFTSQPAYGKTFNHWSKTLSGVLKIFSLVKHRNAAIFLVTISQIKIPTNNKDKEIDIWDNSDLIIFQSIIGYMSRYMWSILQSQEIHVFGESDNKLCNLFCVILRLKQNWSLLFLKSFGNAWKLSNIFWTFVTPFGVN